MAQCVLSASLHFRKEYSGRTPKIKNFPHGILDIVPNIFLWVKSIRTFPVPNYWDTSLRHALCHSLMRSFKITCRKDESAFCIPRARIRIKAIKVNRCLMRRFFKGPVETLFVLSHLILARCHPGEISWTFPLYIQLEIAINLNTFLKNLQCQVGTFHERNHPKKAQVVIRSSPLGATKASYDINRIVD